MQLKLSDFKLQSVLLNIIKMFKLLFQDYNAKLSDFGLAKDGPDGDNTHVSTRVMGTYGYAAPEYVMTGEQQSTLSLFIITDPMLQRMT